MFSPRRSFPLRWCFSFAKAVRDASSIVAAAIIPSTRRRLIMNLFPLDVTLRLTPDLDSFWAHSGGGGQPNPHDFRVLCAEGGQFERNFLDTWIGKMELYVCVV